MSSGQDPWATEPPSKKTVFVISPIGEEGTEVRKAADQTLKHLVRKALPEAKYVVERADEDKHPGAITPRILSKIISADLVLADLSGYNPNVFYELAVAHGHNKPVVHLQKSDERAAFDVKDMRIVRYQLTDPDKLEQAVNDLRSQAEVALDNPGVIETPLTATGRFLALDQSADPQAEVAERLAAIEQKLTTRSGGRPTKVRTVEDTFAIARWVEARVDAGDFSAEILQDLKTELTSSWFDTWVNTLILRLGSNDQSGEDPWATPATVGTTPATGTNSWTRQSDEPPF
jgi:nucleoside 2-deoxyribosyltransferase